MSTCRIRMRTVAAGPAGPMLPGKVYVVPAAEAKDLVQGHYAELIEGEIAAVKPDVEKATTEPPEKPTGKKGNKEKATTEPPEKR